ncbi:MAG: nucleoside phosphorylase [Candidatus Binatia bacterium]
MKRELPILEFDPSPSAVLEASLYNRPADVASHCVITFFQEVIERLAESGRLRTVKKIRSEIGRHPLCELDVEGRRLAVIHPGVGAPLAAALLESVIARGCRKFVVCGGVGVLDRAIAAGRFVVIESAVRDEGTSYHYAPPSRTIDASPEATAALEAVLRSRDVPYRIGRSWTTDAIFRETRDKVRLRREEGCIVVEMEAAAFFAVARFRGVTLGQVVYGGDDVSGDAHDHRDWVKLADAREQLFWIAAEACLRL